MLALRLYSPFKSLRTNHHFRWLIIPEQAPRLEVLDVVAVQSLGDEVNEEEQRKEVREVASNERDNRVDRGKHKINSLITEGLEDGEADASGGETMTNRNAIGTLQSPFDLAG